MIAWGGTRTEGTALGLQIVKLHDIIGGFDRCASVSLSGCIKRCEREDWVTEPVSCDLTSPGSDRGALPPFVAGAACSEPGISVFPGDCPPVISSPVSLCAGQVVRGCRARRGFAPQRSDPQAGSITWFLGDCFAYLDHPRKLTGRVKTPADARLARQAMDDLMIGALGFRKSGRARPIGRVLSVQCHVAWAKLLNFNPVPPA
ncbi:hypothetical protein GGTG_13334 [Gaeumannomyces tritici R3-111a-1]|uniref:Uncharacterized protein n=1 Tax=Gaeumannomyces tritici (strain R3-111a-1) TaxID=644352 RepID=J3PIK5_GAET3|nr:hypothetical protein GGTG_13334 [Gaeumannomyces tritici R3-111a-1]EJT69066.1 hypothetical protein GGTG_13334 [Gaeumannomyces tritici R3-111a-1]